MIGLAIDTVDRVFLTYKVQWGRNMKSRIAMLILSCLLFSGCALTRGEVDIAVPEITNPDSSVVVKLTEISDRRVFEKNPRKANIPSLKDGEISDSSVTKRAVARKRNAFGAALGDILLPKGRTVEAVVREALVKAL